MFQTHLLGVQLFTKHSIAKLNTMALYMIGRVWTHLWTCLDVFGRAWTCLDAFGRVETQLDVFGRDFRSLPFQTNLKWAIIQYFEFTGTCTMLR